MLLINIVLLVISLLFLYFLQKKYVSFNKRVLFALLIGGILGVFVQYQTNTNAVKYTIEIYNIIADSYIRALRMLVYPIISVAILSAMTKLGNQQKIGKSVFVLISTLLLTTGIAAFIAIMLTNNYSFNLNLDFSAPVDNQDFLETLNTRQDSILNQSLSKTITDFITINPFFDLTGGRQNSLASLVIFFILLGIAYLGVLRKDPQTAEKFKNGVDVIYKIVMRLVVIILRLTPYGVLALFFRITSTSSYTELASLGHFILLSYIAIIIMFGVHLLILTLLGFNIFNYLKKAFPLFLFGFVSRSSAAAIPLHIKTQVESLGVPKSIASIGASFGATMGQNGCAGIHPAILATLLATTVGIDPTSVTFIISLIAIITITSFGVAGVGGGATFAAIAVLSVFDMPIEIVALLIAIEPLIDMGRTFLNISGSLLASIVAAKTSKTLNKDIFNDKSKIVDNNKDF